jgi:hypothetical protein
LLRGCLALVFVVSLVAGAAKYPWIWIIVFLAAAGAIWYRYYAERRNKIASIGAFTRQAEALRRLALEIESGTQSTEVNFAIKPGERILGSQNDVRLIEWVSTGSSYQGGSQGFSFRVMPGVYYRVGANRGTIVKNPPDLAIIDVGMVNYTTKRITFVGPQQTREWDVAKVLNLDLDHNGQTVMISVSNRQKPSGLQGSSYDLVAPGFLVETAVALNNGDAASAAAKLRQDAWQLEQVAQETRAQLKLPAVNN